MPADCFQIKGNVVTLLILELQDDYTEEQFQQQLSAKAEQAPGLFQQAPVVISLELITNAGNIDLQGVLKTCKDCGLLALAFKSVPEQYLLQVTSTLLPILPDASMGSSKPIAAPEPEVQTVVETVVEERLVQNESKIVTTPVRSGQQVYAKGCDLIVMAQVSEGAEVLADGNIHIYGALRGRALAGVQGNKEARIFCHSLEAELLSIAGNFTVNEDIRNSKHWKSASKISLGASQLTIDAI